mgnify:CR=1 FL=1
MNVFINLSSKLGKPVLLTFIILTLVSLNFAQTGANLASQATLVTEFDVNGLKVLVKRRPNSQTVAAGLFIRGGSRNLTPQNAGIENLMLNVATEGSQKFPREVLRRELASTGSSISAGANYDFSVMALASTKQAFDRSWEIFTDVAINPAFAPNDVELTREKLLTGLRSSEDDPDGYLQVLVEKTINAKTAYENDPSGTIENVSRFSTQDLRAYHQKVMQTSRLLLVIVGDLDAAVLKQRIAASFGKLQPGTYKDPAFQPFDFSKPTLDVTSRNLPTNYIQGVFDAPSINNPDFYAMRVATTLLRDRVFEEVRVKRNLSYAPSADMGTRAANTGNIYVTAVDANQAISVMLNEISSLKTSPVELREISGVTGQFLTTYFIGQETNAAQAAELARYELIGGGWRNAFEFLNRAKQVTPQDVQRVSQKYMKNLRFVVVGKPEYINRQVFLGQSE